MGGGNTTLFNKDDYMITEIATLKIDPQNAKEFETAVAQAVPIFLASEGCYGTELERSIEQPDTYLWRVKWETVDHHMVKFRQSDNFQKWRALAGPFFTEPPQVVHTNKIEL
jgi:quinol monooxygenase YgiN